MFGAKDALSADDFFAAEFVVLTPSLSRLGNISRQIDAQTRQRHIGLVTKSMWSVLTTVATTAWSASYPVPWRRKWHPV